MTPVDRADHGGIPDLSRGGQADLQRLVRLLEPTHLSQQIRQVELGARQLLEVARPLRDHDRLPAHRLGPRVVSLDLDCRGEDGLQGVEQQREVAHGAGDLEGLVEQSDGLVAATPRLQRPSERDRRVRVGSPIADPARDPSCPSQQRFRLVDRTALDEMPAQDEERERKVRALAERLEPLHRTPGDSAVQALVPRPESRVSHGRLCAADVALAPGPVVSREGLLPGVNDIGDGRDAVGGKSVGLPQRRQLEVVMAHAGSQVEGRSKPPDRLALLPQPASALSGRPRPAVPLPLGLAPPAVDLAEVVQPAKRLEVVGGEKLGDLLAAIARLLLRPMGCGRVLLGPQLLRQPVVGDVADQGVVERVLVLAGDRRGLARNDDVSIAEPAENPADAVRALTREPAKGTCPE